MRLAAARASPLGKDLRPRGAFARKRILQIRTWKSVALEKLSDKFCQKEEVARPTCAPSGPHQEQIAFNVDKKIRSGLSRSDHNDEKAVRQQDGLLFQGRIVPTEFRKDHQNFLAKSYWAAKGSVKGFFDNKCLLFQ
jgi:hypothetical protein